MNTKPVDNADFRPEPLAKLLERWPDILTRRFDIFTCEAGLCEPPSKDRRHVFDFENGLRMIASVDYDSSGRGVTAGAWLHVSFSFSKEWPGDREFIELMNTALKIFVGERRLIDSMLSKGKRVPHFFYEL